MRNVAERGQQEQGQDHAEKRKTKWYKRITLKSIAVTIVVVLALAPIGLSLLPFGTAYGTFSIYNTDYDGLSVFRNELISQTSITGGLQYDIETLSTISSLNALNRFNGSGVLFIIGPSSRFDTSETMSIIFYMLRGGSVVVVDDYGSGNDVLDPIFDALDNLDSTLEKLNDQFNLGIPTVGSFFEQFSGGNTTTGGGSTEEEIGTTVLLTIMSKLKRFGFNGSVLMDVGSFTESPVNPLITDIDHTEIPGYTFTDGVDKVQLEFASIVTFQAEIVGEDNQTYRQWFPLQKITLDQVLGGLIDGVDTGYSISLPFFPLYTSRNTWIETDHKAAVEGRAQPDLTEWGNTQFSVALTMPLVPNGGKMVFIADPSIFINKWTSKVSENDNLRLALNLVEMATAHQDRTKPVPVIFDLSHVYQPINSPTLYSASYMRLIAQISMFPILAPFAPLVARSLARFIVPEAVSKKGLLRTKYRGERGVSKFEQRLRNIKETGAYGEAIRLLYRKILRLLQQDVRFEDVPTPQTIADFYATEFPTLFNRRELIRKLRQIQAIYHNPYQRVRPLMAKNYMSLLKRMSDLLTKD